MKSILVSLTFFLMMTFNGSLSQASYSQGTQANPSSALGEPPQFGGIKSAERAASKKKSRRGLRNPFKKKKKVSEPQSTYQQTSPGNQRSPSQLNQQYSQGRQKIQQTQQESLIRKRSPQNPRAGFDINLGSSRSNPLPSLPGRKNPTPPGNRGSDTKTSISRDPGSSPLPLESSGGLKERPLHYQRTESPQGLGSKLLPPTPAGKNIYTNLLEALKWKVSSLTDQIKRREQAIPELLKEMRVDPMDLESTDKTTLIHWVYPKLIEAMLQLSGESYIKTKVKKSTQEMTEKGEISENLKDSYLLQRKIFEVDNSISGLETLSQFIDRYRNRMIHLLVNHIRVTHDLEPILGINREVGKTSVKFGIRSSTPGSVPEKETQMSKPQIPSANQIMSSVPTPPGLGRLSITNTSPSIVQHLLESAPLIFPFKEYFGQNIKISSVSDVMSYLGRLQGMISDDIIAKKRERQDLDDPNMRIAYGITGKLALEGFEPQAILYRNTEGTYKEYSGTIFQRLSQSPEKCKANFYPDIQINPTASFKETSLPSNQQNPASVQGQNLPAHPTLQQNSAFSQSQTLSPSSEQNSVKDVMVIAYSGSKSSSDWEKNLKYMTKEVSGKNYLLWGYKVHEGIAEAFEQGYNDLGSRIGEMMLKYKRRTLNYLKKCPNTRIELYIITTGHSLGGGLSTLAAIAMKKMAEIFNDIDRLTVNVSNISFAAPPVFRKDPGIGRKRDGLQVRYDWADRAEKFIGKGNILRVFVDRDPVATFSILRQTPGTQSKEGPRSLIMKFLKFKHIGIPLMLYDIETWKSDIDLKKGATRMFWAPHLMPRYGLLLSLFANDTFMSIREYLKNSKGRNQLDQLKVRVDQYVNEQRALEGAIANLSSAINTNKTDEVSTLLNKILSNNAGVLAEYEENLKITEALETKQDLNVADIETKEFGPDFDVKLGQSRVSTLDYTPYFPDGQGGNIFVGSNETIKLTGRTTCEPNKFWRDNMEGKFTLKPGYGSTSDIKAKVSCSCCLMKNLVLSQGRLGTKLRETFRGEVSTSTIEKAFAHCIKRTQCTTPDINALIDLTTQSNPFNAVTNWLNKLGGNASEIWRSKRIKASSPRQ